jgi:hypothetical protein
MTIVAKIDSEGSHCVDDAGAQVARHSEPTRRLFSVHVPKSGGYSTALALRAAYGAAFHWEDKLSPANPTSARILDPARHLSGKAAMPDAVRCVHGHFHPGHFDIGDAALFTMLRHPVDNILSIYFFWTTMPRRPGLHAYFLDQRLSIVETAQLPLLRCLYSRTYFEGFDMGRFDAIRRYEDRPHALASLSQLIGCELDAEIRDNVTADSEAYRNARADQRLRGTLADILRDDLAFYERHAR